MLKYLWVSGVVILSDQLTKYFASTKLEYGQPLEIIPMLNFTLMHNKGAAFNFLSQAGGWQRWFFTVVALVVSVIIVVWLKRLQSFEKLQAVSLALVLGGALGNVIDRIIYGYVIDFIDVYYGTLPHWPAFNIADSAIVVGVVLLLLDSFLQYKSSKSGSSAGSSAGSSQANSSANDG